jgi:hypothetical protein
MFDINFLMFMIASVVARGMRFFLIGWLIWRFGTPIKNFIDKYFNLLATLFAAMLIGFTLLAFWIFGSGEDVAEPETVVVEQTISVDDNTESEIVDIDIETCDTSDL